MNTEFTNAVQNITVRSYHRELHFKQGSGKGRAQRRKGRSAFYCGTGHDEVLLNGTRASNKTGIGKRVHRGGAIQEEEAF